MVVMFCLFFIIRFMHMFTFVRYLVKSGCIPPMCDLLAIHEPRIILVALSGLDNILRLGQQRIQDNIDGVNPYAIMVEECQGDVLIVFFISMTVL